MDSLVDNQQWSPASTNNINGYLQNESNGDSINFYGWDVQRGGIDSGDNEGGEERFAHMEASDVWEGTLNSITSVSQTIVPITAYSLASNIITFAAANSLTAGQTVTLSGSPPRHGSTM